MAKRGRSNTTQLHPADEILLCSVVVAELWFGAERSDPARRANNIKLADELVAKYVSLQFDDLAACEYAAIRSHLANAGQLIGPNDLMIGAIARSHGVTLVTSNITEFSRVPGLVLEDWKS